MLQAVLKLTLLAPAKEQLAAYTNSGYLLKEDRHHGQ